MKARTLIPLRNSSCGCDGVNEVRGNGYIYKRRKMGGEKKTLI